MAKQPSLFHTILAATAAGSCVDAAVLTATRLAVRHRARLYIVHAAPLPQAARQSRRIDPRLLPPSGIAPDNCGTDRRRLHALYTSHCPSLELEDVRIVRGVAWEAVFRSASKLACDLIVMGPHTRSPDIEKASKTNRFLGSTADGVISRSQCPVLIANDAFEAHRLDFKNIVVGVDFSVSCTAAMRLAALFAQYCGAFISAFHMLPIPPYPKYSRGALHADQLRQQKQMNTLCGRLLEGAGYQSVLKPGVQPHVEILQFVEKIGADLIVVGSHTGDRTGKWYAGSVVQRITRLARCPVIVVNGPEALKPWGFVNPPTTP